MSARLSIIGGYLGSGKSTLVNRLLAGVLPGRTAVVVNDFGAVNIDAELIASTSEDTIELTNGCICCQINDDATRVMSALAARGDLDHVICEASGVADPRQLATWRDFPGYARGPLLVCADATAITRLLGDQYVGDTVAGQLSGAELVLVTKTDLATPGQVTEAVAACRAAAPGARIIVQDAGDPATSAAAAFLDAPAPEHAAPQPSGCDEAQARHAQLHHSLTLQTEEAVNLSALIAALEHESGRLVRAKGIVRDRAGTWHEIQLAGGRIKLLDRPGGGPAVQDSRLVLIAAGPDCEQLAQDAAAALAPVLGSVSAAEAMPRP